MAILAVSFRVVAGETRRHLQTKNNVGWSFPPFLYCALTVEWSSQREEDGETRGVMMVSQAYYVFIGIGAEHPFLVGGITRSSK